MDTILVADDSFPMKSSIWQVISDVLFVAGVVGAAFIELRIHETMKLQNRSLRPVVSRLELRRLLVICMLSTLLIAGSLLLPVILSLKSPSRTGLSLGARFGKYFVAIWVLNACYCVWMMLRTTGLQYRSLERYAAAAAIALTSITAALHDYFWQVKPGIIETMVGPKTAITILSVIGFICLSSLQLLISQGSEEPMFDWQYIWVRTWGWVVLILNCFVMMFLCIKSHPLVRQFIPDHVFLALPLVVNMCVVAIYFQCKKTTSASRDMTTNMLFALAIQLSILWAIL